MPELNSEMSREGKLLHDYAAHPEYDRRMLKPNQRDLVDLSDRLAADVIEHVERDADLVGAMDYTDFIEQQMELPGVGEFGRPDLARFYKSSPIGIVIDRKFGYNVVERADLNLQLRVYAVLSYHFWHSHGFELEQMFVGIAQPRAPFDERVTIARYTPKETAASVQQIFAILKESNRPQARLVAGDEQCTNCRAQLTCKAFRETMMVPAVITPDNALSVRAREAFLEQRVAALSDELLAKAHLAVRLSTIAKNPVNDEVRKRVADGKMKGFSVAKDAEVRAIVNVRKAMSLLSLAGVSPSDSYDCVTEFSLGTLAEKLRKKHPNWTWKQANEWINKKLNSVMERSTRKGRILPP